MSEDLRSSRQVEVQSRSRNTHWTTEELAGWILTLTGHPVQVTDVSSRSWWGKITHHHFLVVVEATSQEYQAFLNLLQAHLRIKPSPDPSR